MDMYNDLLTVRSIYNIITVVMGSEGVTAERNKIRNMCVTICNQKACTRVYTEVGARNVT